VDKKMTKDAERVWKIKYIDAAINLDTENIVQMKHDVPMTHSDGVFRDQQYLSMLEPRSTPSR